MYFCYGYSLYFYLTWLPTYLQQIRGFSRSETSVVHTFVLLTAAAASIFGGRLTDTLVKALRSAHWPIDWRRCAASQRNCTGCSRTHVEQHRRRSAAGSCGWRRRSVPEHMLGDMPRRRTGCCWNSHRVHEHICQYRRCAQSPGDWLHGQVVGFMVYATVDRRRSIGAGRSIDVANRSTKNAPGIQHVTHLKQRPLTAPADAEVAARWMPHFPSTLVEDIPPGQDEIRRAHTNEREKDWCEISSP